MANDVYSLLIEKRTMGVKMEATPYTGESNGTSTILTAADYNFPAEKIEYDPEIEQHILAVARGDFSKVPSITGKKKITFKCQVPAAWSGTAATAPSYNKLLQACGLVQASTATQVTLTTSATVTRVPITIEVQERGEGAAANGMVVVGKGCMGKVKAIIAKIGEPMKYDLEFEGAFVGIFDRASATMITPTGFDTPQAEAVLSATISMFDEVMKCEKVEIDVGNTVSLYTDPSQASGYEGAHITNRDPKITVDPDLDSLSNRGNYARLTAGTTGAFVLTIGSHLRVDCPAVQIVKGYKPGAREGHVVNNIELACRRGTSGNDELVITHF